MAKIIIERKKSFGGSMEHHNVYCMNELIGDLKNRGKLEFDADVGTHILTFKPILCKKKAATTFTVVVNDENEVIPLKTYFNMNGDYIVAYADDKPHMPIYEISAPTGDPATGITERRTGLRCPRCKSFDIVPMTDVSTKGKDFDSGNACCGFLLCGPLGLLLGTTGKGKQTITKNYWICKTCGYKFSAGPNQ